MPKPEEIIVIELQAEPWGPKPFYNLTKEERERTMNLQKFKEILEYSQENMEKFYSGLLDSIANYYLQGF